MTEVRALSHRRDIVDIYSNSWGPPDLGFIVAGPRPLARRALQKGINEVSDEYVVHYLDAILSAGTEWKRVHLCICKW